MRVDLHCHSYFSDGLLSFPELLSYAQTQMLDYFSITDHDTILGYHDYLSKVNVLPNWFIPGIECSARYKTTDIHIIGLNIDIHSNALKHIIEQQLSRRMIRAKEIGQLLEKMGVESAFERAVTLSKNGNITRPHFASLLVQDGFAKDISSAFESYLKRGQCAFVQTEWPTIEEVVGVIRQANGIAVLAHPLKYKMTATKLKNCLSIFKEAGGEGIEFISGIVNKDRISFLMSLLSRFDLLSSTGSDYHGNEMFSVGIGRQLQLPDNVKPIWTRWE
jgi:predicted metal-dependent phosphoesterase TrpH